MKIPTALPTQAPIQRDGKKIPAGREAPKVATVKRVLAKAVTSRSVMIVQVLLVLRCEMLVLIGNAYTR